MRRIEFKVCPMCGKERPVSEFTVSLRHEDGHQGYCKSCTRKLRKEQQDKKKRMFGEMPWYLK